MSDEIVNLNETQQSKEKRGWFHSLSRRRSSSNTSRQPSITNNCNNNDHHRNAEKSNNFFKRIRKKLNLNSFRRKSAGNALDDDDDFDEKNGTTDASEEFLTQKPTAGVGAALRTHELTFQFERGGATQISHEDEMIPYSHDFRRYLVQKWKNNNICGENEENFNVMFRASTEMLTQVWYWGEISRQFAQKQLTDKPTGSFLVRDSETEIGFTLSFRILQCTLHYRLEYRENYWRFEELSYASIVEMINDILYRCTNDNFLCFVKTPNDMQPQLPVILKYPLSRYSKMPQLQDICRRAILKNSTKDEIAKLPIPLKLQEYLDEPRGLVFAC